MAIDVMALILNVSRLTLYDEIKVKESVVAGMGKVDNNQVMLTMADRSTTCACCGLRLRQYWHSISSGNFAMIVCRLNLE